MCKVLIVVVSLLFSLQLSACGDSAISSVKNGVLSIDKTTTLGSALDGYKYFSGGAWEAFKDDQKRKVVQFKASYDIKHLNDHPNISPNFENYIEQYRKDLSAVDKIQCVAQFLISTDGKSFEASYMGLEYHFKDNSKSVDQKMNIASSLSTIYKNMPLLSLMDSSAAIESRR